MRFMLNMISRVANQTLKIKTNGSVAKKGRVASFKSSVASRNIKPLVRSFHDMITVIPAVAISIGICGMNQIQPYEEGLKLTLGKYTKTLKSGWCWALPLVQEIKKIDISTNTFTIPEQTLITKDNVSVKITGEVQCKVIDPYKVYSSVENMKSMIISRASLALRNAFSKYTVYELNQNREHINNELVENLKDLKDLGIDVSILSIANMSFDDSMIRAMSRKAEADLKAEASLIYAKNSVKTAEIYKKSAELYEENTNMMRLREIELGEQISKNPASTMFVIPSNMFKH